MVYIKKFGRTHKYKKLPYVKNNTGRGENHDENLNLKIQTARKTTFIKSAIFDDKTLSSNWFCPNMERTQATSILRSSSVGSFIVRSSTSQKSSFVLSVLVPGHLVEHNLLHVVRHVHYIDGVTLLGSFYLFLGDPSLNNEGVSSLHSCLA